MPLRQICVKTVLFQLFSVSTFIYLWFNQKYVSTYVRNNSRTFSVEYQRFSRQTRHPLAEKCLPIEYRNELCPKLFMGDRTINNPKKLMQTPLDPKCRLSELIKDCAKLQAAHEYVSKPVTETERKFPLAFGMKMHRDPEQAEKLLRTIYREHNVYCIYVDGKSANVIYNVMETIGQCFNNVYVVHERLNVVYASYAHLQSDIHCMDILLRKSNVNWKYYINLTGQEFPLKTNLEMVEILRSLNGVNDIESYNTPVFLKWRYEKKYTVSGINMVQTTEIKEPFKYDIQISKGSAYGSFSRNFVEFLLTDDVANEFITWLNDTYSPEENVWATLNTLPWAPGGYEIEIRHRYGTFLSRAINWENDKPKCSGKYVRNVCIFSIGDLPWLGSRPQLIANKFDYHYDHLVLDCLEDLLRNRTYNPSVHALDWYYYRTLPQSKVHSIWNLSRDLSKKKEWLQKRISSSKSSKSQGRNNYKEKQFLPGSSFTVYTVPR